MIVGERDALVSEFTDQLVSFTGQELGELDIEKVEAVPKLDHGSEHSGFLDARCFAFRLLNRPLQRTSRTVLPEVNAGAEPVVGVEAGEELLFAQQDGIAHTTITAMEGKNGALVAEEVHEVSR